MEPKTLALLDQLLAKLDEPVPENGTGFITEDQKFEILNELFLKPAEERHQWLEMLLQITERRD